MRRIKDEAGTEDEPGTAGGDAPAGSGREERAADLQEHGSVSYDSQVVHEEMGPG